MAGSWCREQSSLAWRGESGEASGVVASEVVEVVVMVSAASTWRLAVS